MLLEIIWFMKYILEHVNIHIKWFLNGNAPNKFTVLLSTILLNSVGSKIGKALTACNTYRLCVNPHLIHEDKLAEFSKG